MLATFGRLVGKNLHDFQPSMVRCNHWENGIPATTFPSDAGCLLMVRTLRVSVLSGRV